ncbi:ribonuclease toxin immunity protein CdiI [Comamonas sp. JUb58]|uniref:ribonuclease toxin immunity protein CdiI n=1 Tax=Comamonas sp. JUb58 TaxID=2485114 RepID=UPI00105D4CB3|nr:ribonuclease toxin immunity protein CdiI [Comamonas sp. JUb58]
MDFPIVLCNDFFPAQAFFNSMKDRDFISTLEEFAKGIGRGFDDAVCEFPGELVSEDQPFKGVKFYLFEDEVVLSKLDFLRVLEEACLIYIARHPGDRIRIEELLGLIEVRNDIFNDTGGK